MRSPSSSLFRERRERMVREQIAQMHCDDRLQRAFEQVPRELFALAGLRRRLAYCPIPLSIGYGQTLSQPAIIARLLQLAQIDESAHVLDVGCGSGYQAALISKLGAHVYGIELVPELADRARKTLQQAGIHNVTVYTGDGFRGVPQHAPYDAIVVAAVAPHVPQALLAQLKDRGRLVLPVGPALSKRNMLWRALTRQASPQRLVRIVRQGSEFVREELDPVYFVPLIETHTSS